MARRARTLPAAVAWVFLALGVLAVALCASSPDPAVRSFGYDAIGLAAAGTAVYALLRNRPRPPLGWRLITGGLVLLVTGDIVFDLVTRALGQDSGYPFADILYLGAYPLLACGLVLVSTRRFRRDIWVDSLIVAVAASAATWQWVIEPLLDSSLPLGERLVAAAYPVLDIVLLATILHAVFSIPRWKASAWFLVCSLTATLVGDMLYARLVAGGTYVDADLIDIAWPIAYVFLAAAVLHPSMRVVWRSRADDRASLGRGRFVMLGVAVAAAPAVLVVNGAGNSTTIVIALLAAATAMLVALRIAHLVATSDSARRDIEESEARFRALVQHASDGVVVVDASGLVLYASPAAARMVGLSADEVVGREAIQFIQPDDREVGARNLTEVASVGGAEPSFEIRLGDGLGTWRWIECTCSNQLENPAVRGIVINTRDITEKKQADEFAHADMRAMEQILEGSPLTEALYTLCAALESYDPELRATIRLIDRESGSLRHTAAPTLPDGFTRAVDDRADGAATITLSEYSQGLLVRVDDGTDPRWDGLRQRARDDELAAFWSMPIRNAETDELVGLVNVYCRVARRPTEDEVVLMDRVGHFVALAVDRAQHTDELGYLALHDALTGLPNRALAIDRIEHALERLAHRPSMLAVLFLDLDRFKVVNDALGHDTGDELLIAIAHRFVTTVRRQDTVARLGGDEFVVICEDLVDERQAEELAARTSEALLAPFKLARSEVPVSASIGIAVTRRANDSADSLLRDADAAMYRAKRRGGSRYELFDQAMHTRAMSRLLTEQALRLALDRDELRIVYQPQFELATGHRVGIEALIRWAHPVRGLVAPRDFLPVAEDTGMIVPIGRWVLDQACAQAAQQGEAPAAEPTIVSLNVSARQLLQPDFPGLVARCVDQHGIDPGRICLEVAEGVLVDDLEVVGTALRVLKDRGLRLAIDDFGTGGSSLTYLRRFPFDELKIDSTFVAGLGANSADDAIVAATIDMAHALGMAVAAEGVETEQQRDRLIELGCDRAQGYLLGAPQTLGIPRHLVLINRPA
jgi:diguanylate cyclase (GGDEF)-like protein/PAS domain S-box-containing protein